MKKYLFFLISFCLFNVKISAAWAAQAWDSDIICDVVLAELNGPIMNGVTLLLLLYCIISFILSFKINKRINKEGKNEAENKKLVTKYNIRKWTAFVLFLILLCMHIPSYIIMPVYEPVHKKCKGVGYYEDKCFTISDNKFCLRKLMH